ncbi:MAG TPA: Rrf2 family transcriptional regulator [Candidatus Limnocylindrales bacterium]|nr:Rrf2 family transcriptional regulator [Candidatus Limnocylindrales bacterium]
MQLSTKARYAARAMIELALCYGQGPVKLKDIARRQDISIKYLEQVMCPLRVKGYVHTQKGSQGGYYLAKPPDEVSLYDIVHSVEGSLSPVSCLDSPDDCNRVNICVTRKAWSRLKDVIIDELKSTSLAILAEEQRLSYASHNDNIMYQI